MVSIRIYNGFWNVSYVLDHPKCAFIFGDNDQGTGKKGQAVIRDCQNAYGIPTKKKPTLEEDAFYTDDEDTQNINHFREAIESIMIDIKKYDVIYLPVDGLGTGLSELDKRAPKTFAKMNTMIRDMIEILGGDKNMWIY